MVVRVIVGGLNLISALIALLQRRFPKIQMNPNPYSLVHINDFVRFLPQHLFISLTSGLNFLILVSSWIQISRSMLALLRCSADSVISTSYHFDISDAHLLIYWWHGYPDCCCIMPWLLQRFIFQHGMFQYQSSCDTFTPIFFMQFCICREIALKLNGVTLDTLSLPRPVRNEFETILVSFFVELIQRRDLSGKNVPWIYLFF